MYEHLEKCMREAPNLNGSTARTQESKMAAKLEVKRQKRARLADVQVAGIASAGE